MDEKLPELFIELSLGDGDPAEVDELSRQLRSEIEELPVERVEDISLGNAPAGSKAADWAAIGQMAVTLAPSIIPPLFELLKSWTERRPATPVKVKVRVGKTRAAQIEYDPTTTSSEDLEMLLKALGKGLKS
ncbi:MAG: hypothetical protein ACM3QS_10080 [Bacteroidota bacterium]